MYTKSTKVKNKYEGAQRNHHILPKMQGSNTPHSHHLQGWKKTSPKQRRKTTQPHQKRIRRTQKTSTTKKIRQNNQKTNTKTQMQNLRLHTAKERNAPQKTNGGITP